VLQSADIFTRSRHTTDQIGGFKAGKGYDAVSGWGTPGGMKMMKALSLAAAPAMA